MPNNLDIQLKLNEYKESATKLLGRAERKAKDQVSTIPNNQLAKLELDINRNFERLNENTNIFSDYNIQDSDVSSVISLNVKMRIINDILKPESGFNKEWKLENEFGFEYEDLYNT